LFRLGNELLVRLPRQPGGSATILKEARWLPTVARWLPVAVPEVVAVGSPAFGYPESWSIVRFLEGEVPDVVADQPDVAPARTELARDLVGVVTALRAVEVPAAALADPELRWYRGDALVTRDGDTRAAIHACRALDGLDLDLDAALARWEEATELPGASQVSAPHWYHGDLLAENLLVRDGRLAAVLDFGGLSVGDPTIDLVVAWEVLDAASRKVFRAAVGVDEATWLRGRGWALSLALVTFPYYWRTMPARCRSRLAIVNAVLADAGVR
jgi:aminoglycoside phosphotransferase (APT) family kinase protein